MGQQQNFVSVCLQVAQQLIQDHQLARDCHGILCNSLLRLKLSHQVGVVTHLCVVRSVSCVPSTLQQKQQVQSTDGSSWALVYAT